MQSENKKSLSTNLIEHKMIIIAIMAGILIISGFIGFSEYVWKPMIKPILKDMRTETLAYREWTQEQYDLAKELTDCNELQELRLSLVSKTNTDSWFPDRLDRAMKLANERYVILEC